MLSISRNKLLCLRKRICCCYRKAKRSSKYYLVTNDSDKIKGRAIQLKIVEKSSDGHDDAIYRFNKIKDSDVNSYSAGMI